LEVEFNSTNLDLADSQANEVVCWIVTKTVNDETTKTNKATQTPKASEISAKRSW